MSMETASRALFMAAAHGRPFHVQITGGEPLLAASLVFDILELIREERWPVSTAIQTNGVLLERDAVWKLRSFGTAVGISVDGLPEVQEQLRGGSVATYRAMKLLDEERVPFSVTTVVSDMNAGKLKGLAMGLHALPMASGIGLDLLVHKGVAADRSALSLPGEDALREGIRQLLETIDALNVARRAPLVLREREAVLRTASTGRLPTPFCSACGGRSLAVTPQGELYPCTQTMGDPDFLLGTLETPPLDCRTPLASFTVGGAWCEGCALHGRCPGECPSRLYYNTEENRRLICVLYRTIFDYCKQKGGVVV